MASYTFPPNPTDGQRFPIDSEVGGKTQYQWNASVGVWNIVPDYVRIGNQSSYNSYEWPEQDGLGGQQLTTDGNGMLTWDKKGNSVISQVYLDANPDGIRFQFTLLDGESNEYVPDPPSNLLVFLGGVPQIPGTAYTLNGSEISFSEPPPLGVNFFAVTSLTL